MVSQGGILKYQTYDSMTWLTCASHASHLALQECFIDTSCWRCLQSIITSILHRPEPYTAAWSPITSWSSTLWLP